jgi:hypothetical protein
LYREPPSEESILREQNEIETEKDRKRREKEERKKRREERRRRTEAGLAEEPEEA